MIRGVSVLVPGVIRGQLQKHQCKQVDKEHEPEFNEHWDGGITDGILLRFLVVLLVVLVLVVLLVPPRVACEHALRTLLPV